MSNKTAEECNGCQAAKTAGKDFYCAEHWVMPDTGWVNADGIPIPEMTTND